jgi:hypothetical protein
MFVFGFILGMNLVFVAYAVVCWVEEGKSE